MFNRRRWTFALLAAAAVIQGCQPARQDVTQKAEPASIDVKQQLPSQAWHRVESYRIRVGLLPAEHTINATTELSLIPSADAGRPTDDFIYIALNERLVIESVSVAGERLTFEKLEPRLAARPRRIAAIAMDEPTTQPAEDADSEAAHTIETSAPATAEPAPSAATASATHGETVDAEPAAASEPADSPGGATTQPVLAGTASAPADEESGETTVVTHRRAYYRITLPEGRIAAALTLKFQYAGTLWQDVEAGERAGEIHNFQMSAHIGEEGVYLSPSGYWYPTLAARDDARPSAEQPESPRSTFELTVDSPAQFVLTACGERTDKDLAAPRGESTSWKTPFAIDGLSLVGGPLEIHQRQVGRIMVSLHLRPGHADKAPLLLDAVTSYLTLYQPLLGPYPFREFTVVENFFSSGFAFPGYTLLASAVIDMGENGLRPGYLDHEMLHNWWGNGVLVSSRDGNWCECLTSFCANYMRPILEDHADDARDSRRDTCYGLSEMSREKEAPLDQFDREGEASRFIGYQKGSMVFAMLAERVGEKAMWRSLKRLARERMGQPTNWDDIRHTIERETARPLDQFFRQWVRGKGVPDIRIEDAAFNSESNRLTLTIEQKGDTVFDCSLPIRILFDEGAPVEQRIAVNRALQVEIVTCPGAPSKLEIDPDFHLMRKVPASLIMPTISRIGSRKPLTVARGEDDFKAYAGVSRSFRGRSAKDSPDVVQIEPDALDDAAFAKGHVLLLGRAARTGRITEWLADHHVVIGEDFFAVEGNRYDEPQQALLCCINNPAHEGAVICCYLGNDESALKRASLLTFYGGNSLIVFDGGKPVHREDFEKAQVIPVKVEGSAAQ